MNYLQTVKTGISVSPALVNNATYTSYVIDTMGADFCSIDVIVGTTDAAMATLKVQESDTKSSDTALSSGADVTGAVFGTSTLPTVDGGATSALPTATDDNKVFSTWINLQGRKRYLQLIAVAGNGTTGTYLSAMHKLGSLSDGAYKATEQGLAAKLIV